MKFEIILNPNHEEKVVVYAKENNKLVADIKNLVMQKSTDIFGYKDSEILKLDPSDIYCVTIIDNKAYAICESAKFFLKERLYSIEERLPNTFIRINQSSIANIEKMERFDTSISGTLKIRFKNGYIDYVSRRQLKTVKERIGLTR